MNQQLTNWDKHWIDGFFTGRSSVLLSTATVYDPEYVTYMRSYHNNHGHNNSCFCPEFTKKP